MEGFQKTAAISTVLRNCVWLLTNWKTVVSLIPAGITAWLTWGEAKPWVVWVATVFVFTLAVWFWIGVRTFWGERPKIWSSKLFEIERVIPATRSDYIDLVAALRFERHLRQAHLVIKIGGQFAEKQFVIFKSHEFMAGEQVELTLARVAQNRAEVPLWLPGNTPAPQGIVEGGRYLINIEVRGRWPWQRQLSRVYFEKLNPNQGTNAKFIFVEEDRDLFDRVGWQSAHYG
jgi:hypothetical protein